MKYNSALLTQASGSIGGATASTNRGGNYFRARVAPIQPRTPAQQAVRAALSAFSSTWRTLTAAQILGWNALASGVTLHDSLGNAYKPTGAQLFVECNVNLQNIGLPSITTPPASAPTIPYGGQPTLVYVGTGTKTLTITFPNSLPADAIAGLISATRGLSAGISYIGKSEYRIIGYAGGDELDTGYNILAPYTAKFGAPTTGSIVAVSTTIIDSATGFASQPYTVSTKIS
jgi:hypothetical protein